MEVKSYEEVLQSLTPFLSKARRNNAPFSIFLQAIDGGFKLVGTADPGELSKRSFGIDPICISRETGMRFQLEFGIKVRR